MSIDASLLVIMGIFWVTYVILRIFFFKPLLAILKTREERVESARAVHETALRETDAAIAAQRAKLQSVRQEAAAVRDQARREADEHRHTTLAAARQDAQAELGRAQTSLDAEVGREREQLAVRARRIADEMARRLLGRTA